MTGIQASGLVIFRRSRGILLIKKRDYWEFPKGRVDEKDSDLMRTALREVREETGLVDLKIVEGFVTTEHYPVGGRRKQVTYWLALSKGNPTISSEHRGYVWASPREAEKLLSYSSKKRVLREALAYLKHRGLAH